MKKLFIILIVLALVSSLTIGCAKNKEQQNTAHEPEQPQQQEVQFVEKQIVLFFPDKGNNFLLHEFRKVTVNKDISGENLAKIVLEELVKGTDNTELKSIIPRSTKILSIKLENSVATIDFSEEFAADNYTNKEKLLQVFSVVNSISELGIQKISITVKGKPINEYYTFLKQQMPFSRNDDLIPSK